MKQFTLIISFIFFFTNLFSQQASISTFSSPKKTYNQASSTNHVYKYIISDKQLRIYFIANIIPIDFPEYDVNLDFNSNKQLAIDWSSSNLNLFKQSYRINVGQYFD